MFINTMVTTIYPVTQEQKQAFILDFSLATTSNWSANPLSPPFPSYAGVPSSEIVVIRGGDLFIFGTLISIKSLIKTVSMTGKWRN